MPRKAQRKTVNLALQGGGAHGAYAWGVLDYLLEDGRLDFEGISATSAGAMNACVMAYGLMKGGHEGARRALDNFWEEISNASKRYSPLRSDWLSKHKDNWSLENSPAYLYFDLLSRTFSPYELNPWNFNPLKDVLESCVDFEHLHCCNQVKLFICATNVETGRVRIFENKDMSAAAVLASACLPFLFQTVEVDGEHYWDGGYIGNPAIFPLIYDCKSTDVVIVHINPIVRPGVPKTASDIMNRINEISFNSSLMREMRAIAFVTSLIEQGKIAEGEMKRMLIHSIRCDKTMTSFGVSSKLNADWDFLCHLKALGRSHAKAWLADNFTKINVESTVDIREEFL